MLPNNGGTADTVVAHEKLKEALEAKNGRFTSVEVTV